MAREAAAEPRFKVEGPEDKNSSLIDARSSLGPHLTGDTLVGNTQEASAAANRALSRQIAARLGEAEREKLFAEHERLTMKKLDDGLSFEEACELDLIRWQIDRIHDAEYGPELDRLDALAKLAKSSSDRITDFVKEAQKLTRSR